MVVTLWQLPAWFISPDDKPSYQLFQAALNSTNSSIMATVECKTIDTPTLSELVVQTSSSWNDIINYNYLEWNQQYYVIQDVNYVSANSSVVQIHAQIDLYLSFLATFFNESSSEIRPVFFVQKHLNRLFYQVVQGQMIGTIINPATQFYLLNLHEQLGNVGSKKEKQVYTVNDFEYQETASNYFANDNYFNVNASIDSQGTIMPQAYPVILWQMTANSTIITQASQQTGTNASVYEFPYGLGCIGLNTSTIGSQKNTNPFQFYFLLDPSADLGSEYYTDIYLFPIGLNYLSNQYSSSQLQSTITNVTAFTGWNYTTSSGPNLQLGYFSNQDPVLLLSPTNHLYAVVESVKASVTADKLLLLNTEPALINYANFNVRMYGQDNHIDLSAFQLSTFINDNMYLANLLCYLASFCITISPPNMMLTNIPWSTWLTISNGNGAYGLWNYNTYSDAIYSCQLKATVPSASTNWADYMAENKKSYDMSLNVSQLLAQNAQANIKVAQAKYGGSIASYDNVGADLLSIITGSFGNKVASTYADSIGANVLAPNDAAIQQDKLNYLKTGMKADYTRTSNMRTSAISTVNTLYDSTFCLVLEYPPLYEQITVINYYALFGYKVERWIPFKYWNNRTLCNYVKIANFTNALMTTLNAYYRGAIDSLLNKGIRVWNVAAFSGNSDGYMSIPYSSVIMNDANNYYNVELNENNDELNYLTNASN